MRQLAPATLSRTEQPKVIDRQKLANATDLLETVQKPSMERDYAWMSAFGQSET